MRQIQVPTQDNWWFGDGAFHDGQPVQEREYKRAENIPDALYSMQPFQNVERPVPVYVSENLDRYLREIVPVDKRSLFDVKHTEVEQSFRTEINRAPSEGVRWDPNDPEALGDSVLTDESFTQRGEEPDAGAAEMLREVDAHLVYLRDRLGRLQSFDPEAVRQRARTPQKRPGKQLGAEKRAARIAATPSVDAVGYSNQQAVRQIKEQFFAPSLYELQCVQKQNLRLKTVPRQAGGPQTAMQKRNATAPRPQGKLMPRTPNRTLISQHSPTPGDTAGVSQAIGALSVRSLHPHDPQTAAARHVEIQDVRLQLGDEEYRAKQHLQHYEIAEELRRKREMNTRPAGAGSFVSIPTNNGDITDVKFNGKEDDDVLETTAKILQQLRTDESHLQSLMTEYQKEQNRPPTGAWYENKSATFAQEARQSRLQDAIEGLAQELGCPVDELMQVADPEVLLHMPPKAETKESGC